MAKARYRYCLFCGEPFIGRSRYCKDSHRVAAWKRRKGRHGPGAIEAKRIALAHDPKLRPDYIEPPQEPHPVAVLREADEARRPVDPIWDPWDPMSP